MQDTDFIIDVNGEPLIYKDKHLTINDFTTIADEKEITKIIFKCQSIYILKLLKLLTQERINYIKNFCVDILNKHKNAPTNFLINRATEIIDIINNFSDNYSYKKDNLNKNFTIYNDEQKPKENYSTEKTENIKEQKDDNNKYVYENKKKAFNFTPYIIGIIIFILIFAFIKESDRQKKLAEERQIIAEVLEEKGKILASIKEFNSALGIGVNYSEYFRRFSDTKIKIDQFNDYSKNNPKILQLKGNNLKKILTFLANISFATACYKDAADIWQIKFSGEGVETHIFPNNPFYDYLLNKYPELTNQMVENLMSPSIQKKLNNIDNTTVFGKAAKEFSKSLFIDGCIELIWFKASEYINLAETNL